MKTGKNNTDGHSPDFCAVRFSAGAGGLCQSFCGDGPITERPTGSRSSSGNDVATPFNVMGSEDNKYDKDKQWWSTPYEVNNKYLTGFSHVNLSGVGCPDLGSLLLMPTSGELNVKYTQYGSEYTDEVAVPGYYSNMLTKYGIKCEMTATPRTSVPVLPSIAGREIC